MSWAITLVMNIVKQLMTNQAIMVKKLADHFGQKPNQGRGHGACKGGGNASQTKSGGWLCSCCKEQNKWQTPSCFFCKKEKPQ
eukprot:1846778-Amphidinium_carterae.1